MPKRRERDRPKNAHTSLYNPNKRVVLQYDTDEEADELPAQLRDVSESPYVADNAAADYSIAEYPASDEDQRATITLPAVSEAKQHRIVHETTADSRVLKGSTNHSRRANRDLGTTKDTATGQRPVLGSTLHSGEDEDQAESNGSDEDEALAYLRAVR